MLTVHTFVHQVLQARWNERTNDFHVIMNHTLKLQKEGEGGRKGFKNYHYEQEVFLKKE